MEIMSPEDRVILWRTVIDAEGPQRRAILHAIAREVVDCLGDLDLYGDASAQLTVETLETLDDAGLFARDSVRRRIEGLHKRDEGVGLLVAEMSGLLRDAAGVEHLGVDRRVRTMEMASEWREHVLDRRPEAQTISVAEVAARYGVTTQAVYKWLRDKRIVATRGPGGSWRIPADQFEHGKRPATSRRTLDDLKKHLIRVHADAELPSEDELTANMRRDSEQ